MLWDIFTSIPRVVWNVFTYGNAGSGWIFIISPLLFILAEAFIFVDTGRLRRRGAKVNQGLFVFLFFVLNSVGSVILLFLFDGRFNYSFGQGSWRLLLSYLPIIGAFIIACIMYIVVRMLIKKYLKADVQIKPVWIWTKVLNVFLLLVSVVAYLEIYILVHAGD
mgnify:FL=1